MLAPIPKNKKYRFIAENPNLAKQAAEWRQAMGGGFIEDLTFQPDFQKHLRDIGAPNSSSHPGLVDMTTEEIGLEDQRIEEIIKKSKPQMLEWIKKLEAWRGQGSPVYATPSASYNRIPQGAPQIVDSASSSPFLEEILNTPYVDSNSEGYYMSPARTYTIPQGKNYHTWSAEEIPWTSGWMPYKGVEGWSVVDEKGEPNPWATVEDAIAFLTRPEVPIDDLIALSPNFIKVLKDIYDDAGYVPQLHDPLTRWAQQNPEGYNYKKQPSSKWQNWFQKEIQANPWGW